jgi:hypothetical protein
MNGQMNFVIRLTDYLGLFLVAWFLFSFSPVVPGWTDIPSFFFFINWKQTLTPYCLVTSHRPQFGGCSAAATAASCCYALLYSPFATGYFPSFQLLSTNMTRLF